MKSRDFCYWLQGYLELSGEGKTTRDGMDPTQVNCVIRHLNLVFKHEIDPSAGNAKAQEEQNAIHNAQQGKQPWQQGPRPDGAQVRC